MKDLAWYWYRLRAMSPTEMALHARKKWRQRQDRTGFCGEFEAALEPRSSFPLPPDPSLAPQALREGLRRDVAAISSGRWQVFGGLELRVDLPPRWHKDYLAGQDVPRMDSAFRLNHRSLPAGCDVKLIWELSRWYQLVRLAQAAHVLGDTKAAGLCLDLLEDWAEKNPPYQGWNWTSALEVGMRLIQFTWMDSLLSSSRSEALQARLSALRRRILPAHVHYAWRHRSFGSSANNHLLGELVGLVLVVARWPELAPLCAPLDQLQRLWEQETLAQFASDGGNREQALNYQLFSLEFAWQAHQAVVAVGRTVSPEVRARLVDAAAFLWEVQVDREPWDYGDSDSAYVTPVFADVSRIVQEWRGWIGETEVGASIAYWLGKTPATECQLRHGSAPLHTFPRNDWSLYRESGIAVLSSGFWFMRWDLSPLGYLATAAHGHLDALHLSIWYRGVAMVVDPGTGAYYADTKLRTWFASRAAHNAPCPVRVSEWPRRLGPFLWASHHPTPTATDVGLGLEAQLSMPGHALSRRVTPSESRSSWCVDDRCVGNGGLPVPFAVRWQFAPGATLRMLDDREFAVCRQGESLTIRLSEDWDQVQLVELSDPPSDSEFPLAGNVSSSFRKTERAPYLLLTARPTRDKTCVFTTTFLAWSPS